MTYKKLLGEQNAKTSKGEKLGYITGIMYLAPSNVVKGINVCPFASNGCRKSCLFTAGRGKFSNVKQARINKTILFRDNLNYFMYSLIKDISRLVKKAKKQGKKACIRLNGTSDIDFENVTAKDGRNIFELFPNVQFYDYTKNFKRLKALSGYWSNYHLTFSWSEKKTHQVAAFDLLSKGVNVAIPFFEVPDNFRGHKVIDGDYTDLRFLDIRGVIVGLKAKGDAKKDKTGFVVDANLNQDKKAA